MAVCLKVKKMRLVNKTYYYFEKEDKVRFEIFLMDRHLKMEDFAKKCSISISLLSLIINGRRAITKKNIDKFKKLGFGVKL